MLTKIGIGSLIAGFLLAVMSGISGFMEKETFVTGLNLSKVFGEKASEAIITLIDVGMIQNTLDLFFYEWPLYFLLLGFGVLALFIGLFVKNH